MYGFYIKKLMVVGDGKEPAQITLEKGLNVIYGPSNTGKSYIYQCFDYAFGAKKIKKISESKGYSKLLLEIRTYTDNLPITIVRFLDDKKIYYYKSSIDDLDNNSTYYPLKDEHDPVGLDNISKFLLNQIGIPQNKFLVKNKRGTKQSLGFRAIAHLTVISETNIISEEKSPVLDIQKTQQTYSKSVFRYLLTNQDDWACQEIEKAEIRKAKNDAKIEYLIEEIDSLEKEKQGLTPNYKDTTNELGLDYYKEQIISFENRIKERRKELQSLASENNKLNLQKNKAQITLDKFQLLNKQYLSDLERLEFISSGNKLISQIHVSHCPLCDSEISEDEETIDHSEIIECCCNEKMRIQTNLQDLKISIGDLSRELETLNNMLMSGESQANEVTKEIEVISSKELVPLKILINEMIENAKLKARMSDIDQTIIRKRGEVVEFKESKKIKEGSVAGSLFIEESIYDALCEDIKNSLLDCGYTEVEIVSFDEKTQDIVINGEHRLSNGKGYRAFFFAVFSATLMLYLKKVQHPFSNVLILDSPLTTLKESEMATAIEDDFISNSLQDGLFCFLADKFKDSQAIIIDNKEPPKSLNGKVNSIVFTKGLSQGRYGFFEINK